MKKDESSPRDNGGQHVRRRGCFQNLLQVKMCWWKQRHVLHQEEEDCAELIVLRTGAHLPLAGSRKFRTADKEVTFLQPV